MSKEATTLARLPFKDGDDVLLTHLDSGRRLWAHDDETFSRVYVRGDHIEFRQIDDDGNDIEDLRPVEYSYRYQFFQRVGGAVYRSAFYYAGREEPCWNATGAPLPEMINGFRQRHLTPIGAHSFDVEVRDGDGRDGQFTLQTIMDSLITKKLPVGTDPGYFAHDMHDHATGLSAIDRQCMKSLRQLAMFSSDLAPAHRYESRRIALGITASLDYFSFYKFFATKMAQGNRDPLLSDVLEYSYDFPSAYAKHMRKIVQANGYNVSGHTVTRSPETVRYYEIALDVLKPLKRDPEDS